MSSSFPFPIAKNIKFKHRFDGWCFALVNGKLAEIFFDNDDKKRKSAVWAHCYVKKSEYKTKRERKMIKEDTTKCRFTYRNKKHRLVPDWNPYSSVLKNTRIGGYTKKHPYKLEFVRML